MGGGNCIPQVGKPTNTASNFSIFSIFVFSGGRKPVSFSLAT